MQLSVDAMHGSVADAPTTIPPPNASTATPARLAQPSQPGRLPKMELRQEGYVNVRTYVAVDTNKQMKRNYYCHFEGTKSGVPGSTPKRAVKTHT